MEREYCIRSERKGDQLIHRYGGIKEEEICQGERESVEKAHEQILKTNKSVGYVQTRGKLADGGER